MAGKPNLRLRVTAAAESIVRRGHPWVFADSVREQNRDGTAGELAVIYDRQDRFLAIGLFDPESPIRVRVLHAGKPRPIDANWWEQRVKATLARRAGLFDAATTGYRCVNGEGDGWPGLVVDRYDDTLVMKIYTIAWLPWLQTVTDALDAPRIVLRLSRNIQQRAKEFGFNEAQMLRGEPPAGAVIFLENGLRFEADVFLGQKTGFFLDQRENRRSVEELAEGRAVLNLFSYSGGFSVYAARGKAQSVCSLDISEHALAAARRNFALNSMTCEHETIQADAFAWLQQSPSRRFGLVVLDPPSLARRELDRAEAVRAYGKLIAGGIECLTRDGILVAASCSAHVSAEEFFGIARVTAQRSGRKFAELKTTGHAPDHPAPFAEGQYLKCIYLRFE